MKLVSHLIALALCFSVFYANGATITASTSGDWSVGSTWVGGSAPTNSDNVVIPSGITVTHNANETINDLTINGGGTLVSEATLTINGNYHNDGTHSGTGIVRLQGTGTTMSGTGVMSSTGLFRVNNGRVILSGSNLERLDGRFRCPNSDTLRNQGTLILNGGGLTGNNTSVFVNDVNATLYANRGVLANGSFIASATGNTVVYNRTSIGNQNLNVTIDGYYNLIIDGNNIVSEKRLVENTVVLNDFTVSGSTFTHVDTFSLTVGGDITVTDGVFNEVNGSLTLNGTATQELNMGNIVLNNVNIANTGGGVTIASDSITINGVLTISQGTLNTNGRLIIPSTASGDGAIGNVAGTINGDVVVRRYIDAGATNWHLMGSPVTGATISDWMDDFITSGFPGSHFPTFSFESIYAFDETAAGDLDQGFVSVSNSTALNPGTGFWVYAGDSLEGTAPFTIDVVGPVAQGNVDLAPTFTAANGAADDGWNLVANPYPCAIDWNSAGWTKTNINDAIYVFSPDIDQYATYVGGVGVNGGSNLIASSQAFYVQANAAGPQLVAAEAAKTTNATGFFKPEVPGILLVKITLGFNGDSAQCAIRLAADATSGFDSGLDAYHVASDGGINISIPRGSSHLAIHSIGPMGGITDLDISNVQADYTLSFEVMGAAENYCLAAVLGSDTAWITDASVLTASDTSGQILILPASESTPCERLLAANLPLQNQEKLIWLENENTLQFSPSLRGEWASIFSASGQRVFEGVVTSSGIQLNHGAGVYIAHCLGATLKFSIAPRP